MDVSLKKDCRRFSLSPSEGERAKVRGPFPPSASRLVLFLAAIMALCGCSRPVSPGALVLTQSPLDSASSLKATDILDVRYPAGSRVVLVDVPSAHKHVSVFSKDLFAAGSPLVSYDSRR